MSKSKKAVFLSEWTNEVGQTMRQFHEGAALMVRKHQKSSIKNSTFANTLHSMSQREHSPIVKSAIETLSVELTAGEEHRTHTLAQLQANVVAQFDKYNEKLKVQEENVRARNEAFATFVKKQKAFVNAKSAANPTKQRHAREVFEHEHKRLQSAEQTLNTAIVQFENQRVADMKGFLAKFISSQMYFYTRQLEGLSRAYAEVIAIDPVQEAEKWGEEMRKLEQMEMEQGDISATLTQAAQEQLVLDNPQHNLPTNQPTDQSNQGPPADHSHLNLPPKIDPYATPFNQPTNSNQQSHQNQPQHNSQFNNQVNNQHNNPYNQPINQNNQQQLQSTMSTSPYMNNQPTNQQFNQSNHSNNMQQSQSPYQSTNQQYQATQQTPYNPYNQSNNQSNNNGPYNQSNQSQLNNQYNQSNNQPYNQSNNPSFNQGNHQSFNQSTNFSQSLNKPMNQPMNQSSPFSNTANYANYMNPQPKHNPYSSNQSTNQRGGWQESKQQM